MCQEEDEEERNNILEMRQEKGNGVVGFSDGLRYKGCRAGMTAGVNSDQNNLSIASGGCRVSMMGG